MKLALFTILIVVGDIVFGQIKTGTLTGRVIDEETREPVTGVNILLKGTFLGTTSDSHGNFRMEAIPAGVYTANFTIVGHRSKAVEGVDIRSDEERWVEVLMTPAPIQSEQVVVTASRHEQDVRDVPSSVTTVSAQAIADRVAVTLDDALRYVPGVNMMQDQVNIRGSTGYSRGVGSRVLVLFDGLPFTTGDTGEINWEVFPMHKIDRIEIVKGSSSALYGSNALGGVVNVITKDIPSDGNIRWRLFAGMYDTPRYSQWLWSDKRRFKSGGDVSFSGSGGAWSYDVSVSRAVDESYRENDVYHRWGLFGKAKYNLSTTQTLDVVGNVVFRSHGNFFWWKSLSEATKPAASQLNGNVESTRGNVNFGYKEFVGENFFYTVKGIYFGNFWRDDSAGRVNNVSASHMFYGEVQVTYQPTESNILTFGMSTGYDQVNSNLFGQHPGAGVGLYLQDELKATDEWKWTLGLRFDLQKVSALPEASQLSPKLGLVYIPAPELSLRMSVGSGFRYPSISELFTSVSTGVSTLTIVPNPDLKPERSLSLEVGCSAMVRENILVDAALFQNTFTDLIEAGVDTGFVIRFNNVTRARVRGAEVGFQSSWFENVLSFNGSYTYTDPVDLDKETTLKFRARHLAYINLGFKSNAWSFSLDGRYMSRVEEIDENLVRLAPIINGDQRVAIKVLDARCSYDFMASGLPLRIGVQATNLLNYYYVELIGNLAPVRTYTLVLNGTL